MARSYTHIKAVEKEIFEMKSEGKSNWEIREKYGLSKVQLRNLITRHNQNIKKMEAGITPCCRGRQSKGYQTTSKGEDSEIKRLKMENELLRDFLRVAGRK